MTILRRTSRPKVTAYAVRNAGVWQKADITTLRAEIARADKDEKERALYGLSPTEAAAFDPSDPSDPFGFGV